MRAQARWVHSSARKARLVTDLIRGRSVPEARTILAFSSRAVAKDIDKVLRSAVANAESRPDLHWHGDELVIAAAYADEGPTLKRWRARARGRVARIRKRTCHITIELAQGAQDTALVSMPAMAAPEPEPESRRGAGGRRRARGRRGRGRRGARGRHRGARDRRVRGDRDARGAGGRGGSRGPEKETDE